MDGQLRRHVLPDWMAAECAEARARGDWRAACAAARITVVARSDADVDAAAGMLAGLAPELLRLNLPRSRNGSGVLWPGARYVLAPDGPVGADTVVLEVRAPTWRTSSQRLTLHIARLGDLGAGPVVPLPPYLWDARRTGERPPALREPPGAAAWTAAGWHLDDSVEQSFWSRVGADLLDRTDPLLAAHELRRVAAQFGQAVWSLRTKHYPRPNPSPGFNWFLRLETAAEQLRVTWVKDPPPGPYRAELCLHPALLAASVAAPESAPPAVAERVRVRCRGVWHEIAVRAGRLELLDHTDGERPAELTLRDLGGEASACFRIEAAWRAGGKDSELPKSLRRYRRDLWLRIEHGGSRAVLALLDADLDPHLRDGLGRTLLHHIHQFDHTELLPRLLEADLDVNTQCRRRWTPMCEVLVHDPPADLLLALDAAGAHPRLAHRLDR
ncbi:hypothetical protein [Dactylosporangium sp. NPDC051541]|uniref:hypothetical protein n=1 Tax=Dactylosporangium sp. NPDC051541 TaxID=3363977 RepID=UPI00379ABE38